MKYTAKVEAAVKKLHDLVEVELKKWNRIAAIKRQDEITGYLVEKAEKPHNTVFIDPKSIQHVEFVTYPGPCWEKHSAPQPSDLEKVKPVIDEKHPYIYAKISLHNGKEFDIDADSLPLLGIKKRK